MKKKRKPGLQWYGTDRSYYIYTYTLGSTTSFVPAFISKTGVFYEGVKIMAQKGFHAIVVFYSQRENS